MESEGGGKFPSLRVMWIGHENQFKLSRLATGDCKIHRRNSALGCTRSLRL